MVGVLVFKLHIKSNIIIFYSCAESVEFTYISYKA